MDAAKELRAGALAGEYGEQVQTFAERMLGCGTLTIESAGERGQSVLVDIPGVERVQTMLYELVEADHDKHSVGDGELRDIMQDVQDGKPVRREQPQP